MHLSFIDARTITSITTESIGLFEKLLNDEIVVKRQKILIESN